MTHSPVTPPPTIRRQVRAAGALAVILALVAGAAWGVYWLSAGRAVLAGDRSHDFGLVLLEGGELVLDHTFALTNRSSKRVVIAGVKTSCGCTAAEPSATEIEPGGHVEIAASLKLTRHGKKDAIVFVHYVGGRVDQLRMDVEARQAHRVSVAAGPSASPEADSFERVLFFMDYDTSAAPPVPSAIAPSGIRLGFGPWEQTGARSRSAGLPARWKAAVVISREGDRWPAAGSVVIGVGNEETTIPLGAGG